MRISDGSSDVCSSDLTLNTMLPLQALGCAKHATEKPHVLAKYDHLGILLERNMHRVIDRLDHRHLSHGSDPGLRTLRDEMRRHVAEHVVEHCADRDRKSTRLNSSH